LRGARRPTLAPPLLLLAGAALALRTASVAEYAAQAVVPGAAVTACSVEAMLVLAACVPLAVLSQREVRAAYTRNPERSCSARIVC
jgi:hypothetical protein